MKASVVLSYNFKKKTVSHPYKFTVELSQVLPLPPNATTDRQEREGREKEGNYTDDHH